MGLLITTGAITISLLSAGFTGQAPAKLRIAEPADLRIYGVILAAISAQAGERTPATLQAGFEKLWAVSFRTLSEPTRIDETMKMRMPGSPLWQQLNNVPKQARRDYQARNREPAAIPSTFSALYWEVVNTPMLHDVATMQKERPKLIGQVGFSLPGYDRSRTTAIVLVQVDREKGGKTSLWRISRVRNRWAVKWDQPFKGWARSTAEKPSRH